MDRMAAVTFHPEPPIMRWASPLLKRVYYQYVYSGCIYPFDDPCDDCSHWAGRGSG